MHPSGNPSVFKRDPRRPGSRLGMLHSVPVLSDPSDSSPLALRKPIPRVNILAARNVQALAPPFITAMVTGAKPGISLLQDPLGPLEPEQYAGLPPCSRSSAKALIAAVLASGPERVEALEKARTSRGNAPLEGTRDSYFDDILAMLTGKEPLWYELDAEIDALRLKKPMKIEEPFSHFPKFTASLYSVQGDDLSATCDATPVSPPNLYIEDNLEKGPVKKDNNNFVSRNVVVKDTLDREQNAGNVLLQAGVRKKAGTGEEICSDRAAGESLGVDNTNRIVANSPGVAGSQTPTGQLGKIAQKLTSLELFLAFDESGKVSIDWNEKPVGLDGISGAAINQNTASQAVIPVEKGEKAAAREEDMDLEKNEQVFEGVQVEGKNSASSSGHDAVSHPRPPSADRNVPDVLNSATPSQQRQAVSSEVPERASVDTSVGEDAQDCGISSKRQRTGVTTRSRYVVVADEDERATPSGCPGAANSQKQKETIMSTDQKKERLARLEKAVAGMQDNRPALPEKAERAERTTSNAADDGMITLVPNVPRRVSKRPRRPTGKIFIESSDSDHGHGDKSDEDVQVESDVDAPPIGNERDGEASAKRLDGATLASTAGNQKKAKDDANKLAKSARILDRPRQNQFAPRASLSENPRAVHVKRRRLRSAEEAPEEGMNVSRIGLNVTRPVTARRELDVFFKEKENELSCEARPTPNPQPAPVRSREPAISNDDMGTELWRLELNEIEHDIATVDNESPDLSGSEGEMERGAGVTIGVLQRILRPIHDGEMCLLSAELYRDDEELLQHYKHTRDTDEAHVIGTDFLRLVAARSEAVLGRGNAGEQVFPPLQRQQQQRRQEQHQQPQQPQSQLPSQLPSRTPAAGSAAAGDMAAQTVKPQATNAAPGMTVTSALTERNHGTHAGAGPSNVHETPDMGAGSVVHNHDVADGTGSEIAEARPLDSQVEARNRRRRNRNKGIRGGDVVEQEPSHELAKADGGDGAPNVGSGGDHHGDDHNGGVVNNMNKDIDNANNNNGEDRYNCYDVDNKVVPGDGTASGHKVTSRQGYGNFSRLSPRDMLTRVCGEKIEKNMIPEAKRKVLRWAAGDVSWFHEGADEMEVIVSRELIACERCSTGNKTELCEEIIALKLMRDTTYSQWQKMRRMRHKVKDS